jgi:integrase
MWVTNGVHVSPEERIAYDKMSPADKIAYAKQHPGKWPFGNSLFLTTRKSGKGYWVQQYRDGASFRSKSLGPLAKHNSHTKATNEAKRFWNDRDKQKGTDETEKAAGPLFSVLVTEYLDGYERDGERVPGKSAGWRGTSEADTYRRNLIERGELASMHVVKITPQDIAAHLRLFEGKPKLAERVRSHVFNVMASAIAREFRKGDNPAAADGPLAHLSWPKVENGNGDTVEHHPAMPSADVPTFFRDLQAIDTPTARALSFILLTAVRAKEAVSARWCDIDLAAKVWNVPGQFMKGRGKGHPHAVPLTLQMLDIIGQPSGEFVFPGEHNGHVGPKNPLHTLRMVYAGNADVHGMRSTFSDWVIDHTDFPDRERLADLALAHYKKGATQSQRDYQRTLQAERRRPMMQLWSDYVTGAVS